MIKFWGFEINFYDKCVVKKVIEVTQCTIDWYVDDNNLSHKNPELILDIMNEVRKHFEELSIVKEKNHTFLVMNTKIKDNMIQVGMVK